MADDADTLKITSKEKAFGRCLINSFSHELGNALTPLKFLVKDIENGSAPDKWPIQRIVGIYARLEEILHKFRKMGSSNFKNISIESDKAGLISQVRTQDSTKKS